jgi:glycosyltransferase involved in cell wall biosynthesis
MVDFTVAICTYNGETRLPEVLERLRECYTYTRRSLLDSESIDWEIIVVDNNSTDNTVKVVRAYQTTWSSDCPLKLCFEPQQGLAFARQQAITNAKGKFIGFIDDDNLPNPEWVAAAYTFGQAHPQAGAFGGLVLADCEGEVPEDFEKVACFLSIVDRGANPFIYDRRQGLLPPGAGLVVRRQAWCETVPNRLFLAGRVGKFQLASEDLEALSYIQNGGWEIWYNPQMCIHHKIPPRRMERDYLLSIVRGTGLARHQIRMVRLKAWQRPILFPLYLINDLRKLISLLIEDDRTTKTELAVACDIEFLRSSLLSPFYLWSKQANSKKK